MQDSILLYQLINDHLDIWIKLLHHLHQYYYLQNSNNNKAIINNIIINTTDIKNLCC